MVSYYSELLRKLLFLKHTFLSSFLRQKISLICSQSQFLRAEKTDNKTGHIHAEHFFSCSLITEKQKGTQYSKIFFNSFNSRSFCQYQMVEIRNSLYCKSKFYNKKLDSHFKKSNGMPNMIIVKAICYVIVENLQRQLKITL